MEKVYLKFPKQYHGKTFGGGRVITDQPFEETNPAMVSVAKKMGAEVVEPSKDAKTTASTDKKGA